MLIYAGIDEAGYGPLFGPLVIGRMVMALPHYEPDQTPDLWELLAPAVCKELSNRRGRLAINDSKKVHSPASGITHLERGVLSFIHLAGKNPADLGHWLDVAGETCHRSLERTPWYAPTAAYPWQKLPITFTAGELSVSQSMLARTAQSAGVQVLDFGASVVFEDRFNQMVAATHSKASTSFTFVAGHLLKIWETYGHENPMVIVDRQSGRTHYRELLAMNFPDCNLTIAEETDRCSAYVIAETPRPRAAQPPRSMTVKFEVESEARHMPTALASMICKYTRETLMARFQHWFTDLAPQIKPTAGYASDAKRFWKEIEPRLAEWGIREEEILRQS